jgi:hypothetical protein
VRRNNLEGQVSEFRMRRLTLKILTASLTFIVGVGLATAWLSISPRPLPLCPVADHAALYDGKVVRVSGELYVSADGTATLNGPECGLQGNAWADVYFTENPKLIEELRQSSAGDDIAKAKVVLSGKFEEREHHCFSLRFKISEANLERASEISVVNFPAEIKKEDARNGN